MKSSTRSRATRTPGNRNDKLVKRVIIPAGLVLAIFGFCCVFPVTAIDIATFSTQTTTGTGAFTVDNTSGNYPVVTAVLSLPLGVKPGGVNYTRYVFLAEDSTGSIDIFGPTTQFGAGGALPGGYVPAVGDAISFVAQNRPFNQVPEASFATNQVPAAAITKISSGNTVPGPLVETIPDVNNTTLTGKPYAGHLITVNDLTIIPNGGNFGDIGGGINQQQFTIVHSHSFDNAEDSMVMFFDARNYSVPNSLLGTQVPSGRVSVTGLMQVFGTAPNQTPELLPMSITAFVGTPPTGQVFWAPGGTIGGSGAWNTSDSSWNSNNTGTGSQGQFTSASFAAFTGASGTVTIGGGGIISNGVEFDSTGFIVTGGTLTVGNNVGNPSNNITIGVTNAADTATINAPIAGTGGIQKIGPGTLVLGSGSSSFLGGVKVGEGKLSVKSNANLGDSSNFIKLSGGTLVIAAGGDLQIDANNFALPSGHDLQGVGGGLDVGAGHTLTVNGNASMQGALGIPSAETIVLAGGTKTLGGVAFSSAGGTLKVGASGTDTVTMTGAITNSTGGAATIQAGFISYTGNGGTISIGSNSTTVVTGGLYTQLGTAGSHIAVNGAGTLDVQNMDTNFITSLQIGTAGTAGPTVLAHNVNALGAAPGTTLFFNSGTINNVSGGPLTYTAGLKSSIGGIGSFPTTYAGSDMVFPGAMSLFRPGSGAVQIKVNAGTTVSYTQGWDPTNTTTQIGDGGTFANTSGFVVSGGGTFNLSAASGNFNLLSVPVVADGATINFNGTDPNNDGVQIFATGSTTVFTTTNLNLGANNGGRLNLQQANAFAGSGATPKPARVSLGGGTLGLSGNGQTFGTLTVSSEGSTLDVGAATVSFADSSAVTWGAGGPGALLRINNWTSGSSHITFAGTGLLPAQQTQTHFTTYLGTGTLSSGELLPSQTTTRLWRGDLDGSGKLSPTPVVPTSADLTKLLAALADLNGYLTNNIAGGNGFGTPINTADLLDIADVNNDGVVNNSDIQAEIKNLINGTPPGPSPGGGAVPVPEPSTLLLGLFGTLASAIAVKRRRKNGK